MLPESMSGVIRQGVSMLEFRLPDEAIGVSFCRLDGAAYSLGSQAIPD
jgi:hypothetical protein